MHPQDGLRRFRGPETGIPAGFRHIVDAPQGPGFRRGAEEGEVNNTNRRILFVSAVGLMFALLAVTAPTSADKPIFIPIELGFDHDPLVDCGSFLVLVTAINPITLRLFFDKDGNLIRITYSFEPAEVTYENSVTGKTVAGFGSGAPVFEDPVDGKLTFVGLFFIAKAMGGPIAIDAGRFTFVLATGEVLHSSGLKSVNDGAPFSGLCTLMA